MSTAGRVDELLRSVLPPERVGTFAGRDGVPDRPLAAPGSADEALEVLRLARSEGWSLLPLGQGTKLGWARPPERVDLVLSTRELRGIVAYEPDDGTVTARAGTAWSELVERTSGRHHLSPELALANGPTLGGVLGAGASGLDRLRHGPLRHQVLGLQALHADGSRVKSGGRVVKNVTGYDLHRLWCGSHGSLCFLLEATLRLYPAAARTAVLRARCHDLEEGISRSHELWRAGIQPLALVLRGVLDEAFELALVLSGREEAVESEVQAARARLGEAELLTGAEALRARAELREQQLPGGTWPALALACRPSRLGGLLSALRVALGPERPALVSHPLLATLDLGLMPDACHARRDALEALAAGGVALHWRGLGSSTPPARVSGPALVLMQRVKSSLDPEGLFPRGRFHDAL